MPEEEQIQLKDSVEKRHFFDVFLLDVFLYNKKIEPNNGSKAPHIQIHPVAEIGME